MKNKQFIMQSKNLLFVFAALFISSQSIQAQYSTQDSTFKRYYIGSTFFLLGNLAETNKPDFVQLNFGYRLSEKDVVSIEAKTWKYAWPLGINGLTNEAYGNEEEKFPGYIREFGFALVYQRFWWKGLYTGVHVMSAWQNFVNENNKKIDDGFQIFNTYRLGYHIKLFKGRFFIEPSIAVTHRPYHTKMPEGFRKQDDKWSKFLFGEPGLHFGFNF
jgi:hypothetical protein